MPSYLVAYLAHGTFHSNVYDGPAVRSSNASEAMLQWLFNLTGDRFTGLANFDLLESTPGLYPPYVYLVGFWYQAPDGRIGIRHRYFVAEGLITSLDPLRRVEAYFARVEGYIRVSLMSCKLLREVSPDFLDQVQAVELI